MFICGFAKPLGTWLCTTFRHVAPNLQGVKFSSLRNTYFLSQRNWALKVGFEFKGLKKKIPLFYFILLFIFPASLKDNWQIKIKYKIKNKNFIYLRCTTWCFEIYIHCKIITTIKLINISITSHSNRFLFFWSFLKIEI